MHGLGNQFSIVFMGDSPQHSSVVHQRIGREAIYAVCTRAHVQKLAFALAGIAPLKDHSRHILGNQREPLTGQAPLLVRLLVLGDVELNAVHAQRLSVSAALENSAGAQYPAPCTVFRKKPMVPAE